MLKNTDNLPVEIYYQYLNHYLDFVDIYLVDQNDSLLTRGYFGARRLQPSYKSFKMNPVYDIALPPGGTISLYLRIQSDTPLRIPIVFNSSDSLVKMERKSHVFLGFFYVLFTQRFFSQEKTSPVVSSLFRILKILTIIFFAWYLIDYYPGNKIAIFFMPLLMLSLLSISLIYWMSGAKLARFFFWAMFITLAGAVLHVLANSGVVFSHISSRKKL